jgi:hypothetical protein
MEDKLLETQVSLEYPYAIMYEDGVSFVGNKIVDFFRTWIFNYIKMTARLFYGKTGSTKEESDIIADKILYVIRDWGIGTTVNRECINSLQEYCGADKCELLVMRRYDDVYFSILSKIKEGQFSHVLFDTRIFINEKGVRGVIKSLCSAYRVSEMLNANNVMVLCGLLDSFTPGDRLTAELATSKGGVAIAWGSVGFHETVKMKHKRKIGPLFHPISFATWSSFEEQADFDEDYDLSIICSDYDPRKSFINALLPKLKEANVKVYYNTKKNLPYVSYLKLLAASKIGLNFNWVPGFTDKYQLNARNFETMFAGSMLIAQPCYGLNLYVQDGVDYISFCDVNDLFNKIIFYLRNQDERERVALSGQNVVRGLIKSNYIWKEIDKALFTFYSPPLPKAESMEPL